MRKWTKKIGCFAMAAAMFLSVDLGGLSIQNVEAAGTYSQRQFKAGYPEMP